MGLLISLSGLDGSGKTTQGQMLYKLCQEHGVSVNMLHLKLVNSKSYLFESKCKLQQLIAGRNNLETKEIRNICSALLFRQKVENIIYPSIQKNDITIVDRYIESALCYHYCMNGLYPSVQQVYSQLVVPDLNFFLDVTPEICWRRLQSRSSINKFETKQYLDVAYTFYCSMRDHFIWIDGNKSEESISKLIFQWCKSKKHITDKGDKQSDYIREY